MSTASEVYHLKAIGSYPTVEWQQDEHLKIQEGLITVIYGHNLWTVITKLANFNVIHCSPHLLFKSTALGQSGLPSFFLTIQQQLLF